MSRENVEIVRSIYDAGNRGDWDTAFRDAHPDFEVRLERAPSAEPLRGREDVQEWIQDLLAPFESSNAEPEEFFESDDQVVAFVAIRSRPHGSSAEVEVRVGHLWTIRDGTVLSLRTFPKREKALEAAGLEE